ncbi:GNAT family N-acetyltransferase [Kribbella albertanoniae]|uniref:GNAT family N-acetyltransferase n=1 Tax=Kribbella albertanoniae TaxID=1266829 RepID=A0A4R4P238_9ACTN|nr:GNAT family N-acetyltransferase [Kribbella albertanoniae]TDC14637.1 GNAT family N-acetyltransferase [Kribbella albertanoniae]
MIAVRRAAPEDTDAVRRIGLITWPVAYAGLASPEFITDGLAQWWSREAVERSIRSGITLVAEENGVLVGMVGLGQEEGFWVMWKLYVLPDQQGRGVGKALLDAAVDALPTGTPELLLDVMVDNAKAIGFYEAYGFGEPLRTPTRDLGDELKWMRLGL